MNYPNVIIFIVIVILDNECSIPACFTSNEQYYNPYVNYYEDATQARSSS